MRASSEVRTIPEHARVLNDLTSRTTVELSIVEIRDYQPPEAPTLATRVRRAFVGSLSSLESAGEGLLIAATAAVPWLPVFAVGSCPAYFMMRRVRRSRTGALPNRTES